MEAIPFSYVNVVEAGPFGLIGQWYVNEREREREREREKEGGGGCGQIDMKLKG